MIVNGIDVSGLTHADDEFVKPVVPGRVVHIDGDFLAYMVAYDETKSIEEMKHNCSVKIEKIRKMSAAESAQVHLTPKESNKGNRKEIAMIQEYQAKRKGVKPRYLHLIRAYMHEAFDAIQHVNCEADDGMSIAQYKAIREGNRNLSIIATKDKDLRSVPGLALDWDTGEIEDTTDDFGYITLSDAKATKKVLGRGWKYFWAQMLMGDSVDNISGLPMCCTMDYLPRGKHKTIGPVLTFDILNPVRTNKEAFTVVKTLYTDYHNVKDEKGNLLHPFKNYRDDSVISPGLALVSNAKLLWMRRELNEDDVLNWMKETCV